MNAITYKEVFPLLKDNKIWLGYKSLNHDMYFNITGEYKEWLLQNKKEGSAYKIIDGVVMGRLASACWFTNLDHAKRHQMLPLDLGYTYYGHEDMYPKYDNYDAINVDKVSEIPCDYDGVMGVPITFLDKYCPEQFEIVDINPHFFILISQGKEKPKQLTLKKAGRKDPYARVLIKKR